MVEHQPSPYSVKFYDSQSRESFEICEAGAQSVV